VSPPIPLMLAAESLTRASHLIGSRNLPIACGVRTTRKLSSWPLPLTGPPRSSTFSRSFALVLALHFTSMMALGCTLTAKRSRHAAEPAALAPLIRAFSADRLVTFLRYIRDWNTKLRFRSVAQQLLAVVLRSYPPSVICGLPDIKTVRRPPAHN
jgi:hypothetical protein